MADRTVNVNINYKVNTAEVLKAEEASRKADQATMKLVKSTQDYDKAAVKAGQDAAKAMKGVEDSTKKVNPSLSQTVKGFGDLVNAAKLFITAGIAREVVDIAINMAKLSGNVESVSRAFSRIPNSVLLMDQLKKSTHGTVTELELMQRALQAKNFGIPVEQLGHLLEFASVRAQQTGQSVDYLVDSIVNGIGRKSPLILDNLGISATKLQEKLGNVSKAQATTQQFAQIVGQIATEELAKMGGFAETSATKVDQLAVAWNNLKVVISQKVSTGGFIDLLKQAAEGARLLLIGAQARQNESIKNQALLEAETIQNKILNDQALKGEQERKDAIQQEINTRVQLIGKYNDEINKLKERKKELSSTDLLPSLTVLAKMFDKEKEAGEIGTFLTKEQTTLRSKLNEQREQELKNITASLNGYVINKAVIEQTLNILDEYNKSLNEQNQSEAIQLGLIEAKKEQIKELTEQVEAATTIKDLRKFNTELAIAKGELADLERQPFHLTDKLVKLNDVGVFVKKDGKRQLKEATEELGQISGAVERLDAQLRALPENPIKITPFRPEDFADKVSEQIVARRSEIAQTFTGIFADQLSADAQAEADSFKVRLQNVQDYYDRQKEMAGDNAQKKKQLDLQQQADEKKLRKQAFEADKEAKRKQTVINGAAAIINAFATLPLPAALVEVPLIIASTLSQVAIINKQQLGFKKGVINLQGPGNETSDSISARLSKGESVMTAEETRKSGNILRAIRAKKIDDSILRSMQLSKEGVKVIGMSDERIVQAIKEQRAPDLVRHGNLIYEARTSGDTYRKLIRSKSMGT